MVRCLVTIAAIALVAGPVHAGDSIEIKGTQASPKSISYVGYDGTDANGNPVCTPCEARRDAEAARQKAYAERRERSRQYMARLQGNDAPVSIASDSIMAANAEPLPSAKASPDPIADVKNTPLRANMQ